MDNQPQAPFGGQPQGQARDGQTLGGQAGSGSAPSSQASGAQMTSGAASNEQSQPYKYIKLPDFMLENQNVPAPESTNSSWIQPNTKKIMIIGGILGVGMILVGLVLLLVINNNGKSTQQSSLVTSLREQIVTNPITNELRESDFKNMMTVWDGSLSTAEHQAAYSKAQTALKNTRTHFKNIQSAAAEYAEALGVSGDDSVSQIIQDNANGKGDSKYAILAPVMYYVSTLDDALTDMEMFVTIGSRYYNAGYTTVDEGNLSKLSSNSVAETKVEGVFSGLDEMSSKYAGNYVGLKYEYLSNIAICYEDYANYLTGLSAVTTEVRTDVDDCRTLFKESAQEIQDFTDSAEYQRALNTWSYFEFNDNGWEAVKQALEA